ncbi:hypothetical protein FZEAL_2020 [Fusarium zealandicum]|uniref:Ribosomal RNA methyltransferase FtsJ domain-containing protein n=1 Tax=Fusarium zealandicum TaxID=1053134 RepID=A0A8H4USB0_9HYPO|nr:hypothetical protein FZEAL_2020 [Fusarium zealandicum]
MRLQTRTNSHVSYEPVLLGHFMESSLPAPQSPQLITKSPEFKYTTTPDSFAMASPSDSVAEDAASIESQDAISQVSNLAQLSLDDNAESQEYERGAQKAVRAYLLQHVEEFRHLQEMRTKGWESTEGDAHFNKQRQSVDNISDRDARFFYGMMQRICKDLDDATRAFDLSSIQKPAVLDMCMAPGGFIAQVLKKHPEAQIRAMTLPVQDGGHKVLMKKKSVQVESRDITTLAGDMGLREDDIPSSFPDTESFQFKKIFAADERFNLVCCDGAVLRTHQRPAWREPREATRLTLTQLALGLEHLSVGGTMVVLLHKLDSWRCFDLIHKLSKFSNVQVFKHPKGHKVRSSFYLVAKNIRSTSTLAEEAITKWKKLYKVATLGTDEEYAKMLQVSGKLAEAALEEFGEKFVALGRPVWKIQANALENASFIKKQAKKNKVEE